MPDIDEAAALRIFVRLAERWSLTTEQQRLGEISLVGPRPPLPSEIAHYDEYAQRRLTVPQGMTCLWQINGRCDVSFDEWMRLDNRCIDTWSPLRDLAILARTIPAVFRKDGAH